MRPHPCWIVCVRVWLSGSRDEGRGRGAWIGGGVVAGVVVSCGRGLGMGCVALCVVFRGWRREGGDGVGGCRPLRFAARLKAGSQKIHVQEGRGGAGQRQWRVAITDQAPDCCLASAAPTFCLAARESVGRPQGNWTPAAVKRAKARRRLRPRCCWESGTVARGPWPVARGPWATGVTWRLGAVDLIT